MKRNPRSHLERSAKIRNAASVLEEIRWLIDSRRGAALKELPDLLKDEFSESPELSAVAQHYASPNPNKHFLIGVLPRLFQDQKLFPSNEDIAEFAASVLHVNISRFEKRSKYELIGLIVCQTNELDEEKLSKLVEALARITSNEEGLLRIVELRKHKGVNWNEAIQFIAKMSDE